MRVITSITQKGKSPICAFRARLPEIQTRPSVSYPDSGSLTMFNNHVWVCLSDFRFRSRSLFRLKDFYKNDTQTKKDESEWNRELPVVPLNVR